MTIIRVLLVSALTVCLLPLLGCNEKVSAEGKQASTATGDIRDFLIEKDGMYYTPACLDKNNKNYQYCGELWVFPGDEVSVGAHISKSPLERFIDLNMLDTEGREFSRETMVPVGKYSWI